MEKQNNQNYSDEFGEGDYGFSNFNMDPKFYSHLVLRQVLKAPHWSFANGQINAGLLSIVIGVDQLENICLAKQWIEKGEFEKDEAYKEEIAEIEKNEKDDLTKQAKKANVKLRYLMEKIFKKGLNKKSMEA